MVDDVSEALAILERNKLLYTNSLSARVIGSGLLVNSRSVSQVWRYLDISYMNSSKYSDIGP